MLFNKILNEKDKILSPNFDELFNLAIKNQTHPGDLLLVMENAVLGSDEDPNNPANLRLYYNIGSDIEGHCEGTNHDFIREYVMGHENISYEDYLKLHEYSAERSKEIDQIAHQEAITIQVEMLIYLKIWEGETFLKKWYELCMLINAEDYDWHFKIKSPGRSDQGSLPRYKAFNYVKDTLKDKIPQLYGSFLKCHRSQIRNAIAHSQYAILGRNILLNNKNKDDDVGGISFNEWIDIFHETIILFELYLKFFDRVKEYYFELSTPFNLKREIRVNRKFPSENSFLTVLHSREHFKDWSPYPNP